MSDTKIFISHSHDDPGWARAFVTALTRKGLSLWYDELDIKPGASLVDALDRALRESDAIVFILNSKAIASKALFWELGAAVALNKKIIPVISDDLDRSKIPIPLLQKRYLVQREPAETAEEVARAVA